MEVVKEFTFAAAHLLPDYDGPCRNLHGHEWRLQVGVSGDVEKTTGMVVDFKNLKKTVESAVIDALDHTYLNDLISYPTAEIITEWIVTALQIKLPKLSLVRLYETPTSYVEWRRTSESES